MRTEQFGDGTCRRFISCLSFVRENERSRTRFEKIHEIAAKGLAAVVDNKASLRNPPPVNSEIIKISRFDPAIPEYSSVPKGPFDYVVCTDVLEHLPDAPRVGFKNTVLYASVAKINSLSDSFYINASCRPAVNTLPNGDDAHCTIKSAEEWFSLLSDIVTRPLSPVFSRDLTSCSFIKGEVLRQAADMAYEYIERFGYIDLIAYPPSKEMSSEKLARLKELQSVKREVIANNIRAWERHNPEAAKRPAFTNLVKNVAKGARLGASQKIT